MYDEWRSKAYRPGGEWSGEVSKIQPGHLVAWQHGAHRPLRMVGKVTELQMDTALVEVNGEIYEVKSDRLLPLRTCANCGCELRYGAHFCSAECRYEDLHRDYDEWVFEAIVNFKRAHDGWSPSLPILAERTGVNRTTVSRALQRLQSAGRIQVVGKLHAPAFIVKGGRWVYEEQE